MWTDLSAADALPLNSSRSIAHGNKRILLVRSTTGVYALDDRCPHQERSLEGADIEPTMLSCPFHSVRIDLATGKIVYDMGFVGMPPVKVFPAREDNGRILVDLPSD